MRFTKKGFIYTRMFFFKTLSRTLCGTLLCIIIIIFLNEMLSVQTNSFTNRCKSSLTREKKTSFDTRSFHSDIFQHVATSSEIAHKEYFSCDIFKFNSCVKCGYILKVNNCLPLSVILKFS